MKSTFSSNIPRSSFDHTVEGSFYSLGSRVAKRNRGHITKGSQDKIIK